MQFDESMIGVPIYTRDGSPIGKLKEVQGRYFKVDAPLQPDYWLTEDQVAFSTQVRSDIHALGEPEPMAARTDVEVEYRAHWQTRFGAGGSWEDFAPGYRDGHEMAYDPRFSGRDWDGVEPELRQNYGSWAE
jgi:hypothetical protein